MIRTVHQAPNGVIPGWKTFRSKYIQEPALDLRRKFGFKDLQNSLVFGVA